MKKLFKRTLSIMTLSVLTSSLISGSITVNADIADSGNDIVSECTQIDNLKSAALANIQSAVILTQAFHQITRFYLLNVKVLKQVQKLIIQHPLKIQFLMKPSKILRIL